MSAIKRVLGAALFGATLVAIPVASASSADAAACYYANSYYTDATGSRGCLRPYGDDISVKDTKADYHSAYVGLRRPGVTAQLTLWVTTGVGDWAYNPNYDLYEDTYYMQACTGESSTWSRVACGSEYSVNAGAQLTADKYVGGLAV